MADFEEALNSLLSNPEAMGQILSLAGSLGGQVQESPDQEEEARPPAPTPLADAPSFPDLGQLSQMGRLLEVFQAANQTNEETAALIAALRPFLREERRGRLDRAIQIARMTRMIRAAITALGERGQEEGV